MESVMTEHASRQTETDPQMQVVFKILRLREWADFCISGRFEGSPDDQRDGFIHLSARDQVAGTLAKYFAGEDELRLIAISPHRLPANSLKWEPSRGGALFPHLYAVLYSDTVIGEAAIARLPDGRHDIPDHILLLGYGDTGEDAGR